MSTPDWKRVAAERLAQLRILRRANAVAARTVRDAVERELRHAIHASCIASVSDPRVVRMIENTSRMVVLTLGLHE